MKKLYRSSNNVILGGVLAGFAEYIDKDVTIVRILYVLITLFTCFLAVIFYIACWFLMPKHKSTDTHKVEDKDLDNNIFTQSQTTIVDDLVSQETTDK
jgi:phage shock protein PspC (stress-responsive transcriptional regulator)